MSWKGFRDEEIPKKSTASCSACEGSMHIRPPPPNSSSRVPGIEQGGERALRGPGSRQGKEGGVLGQEEISHSLSLAPQNHPGFPRFPALDPMLCLCFWHSLFTDGQLFRDGQPCSIFPMTGHPLPWTSSAAPGGCCL